MLPLVTPTALLRIPEPFDHPEFLYEWKIDGFRALAYIDGHHCRLISRRGNVFKSWPYLNVELAHGVRCIQAVIDGEIACLAADGRSVFNHLLFRREWPYFMAFDLLALDGRDLRQLPLVKRKAILKTIIPRRHSRVRYVGHVDRRGVELFRAACNDDLEGIVAKWRHGTYQSGGATTSWLKIKNPDYTQAAGRHEMFATRSEGPRPSRDSARRLLFA